MITDTLSSMERGGNDLDGHRVRLRRELLARRRKLRARAYEAAVLRLEEAASDYARELHDGGAEFLAKVVEATATLPPTQDVRVERRAEKKADALDDLVIREQPS
jgi:hypothetical protein